METLQGFPVFRILAAQCFAQMRGNLLRLVESYDGADWCTGRVLERVAAVNAWDALQAARRTGDHPAQAHHLWWLLARPQRLQALLEILLWRFRMRRRTGRVRVTGAPALSDT